MIAALVLTVISSHHVYAALTCKFPFLNATLHGRLGLTHPISQLWYDDNASDACKYVQEDYVNSTFRVDDYGATLPHASDDSKVRDREAYLAVESAADVRHAFAFANSTKNTGHDFIGRSALRTSSALWTHNLNSMSYNPAFIPECGKPNVNYTAIILGAGAQWYDVYKFADEHNVTVVGGYHPTVGTSGGWLIGAGYSVPTPTLGLGVDRVLQFKIVTPDGVYRTANACQNTDLFWALRGGGGGTFGGVLESTVLATPQLTLQVTSVSFNRTEAGSGGHIYGNSFISVNPLLTHEEAVASMKNPSDYTSRSMAPSVLPTWREASWQVVFAAETSWNATDTEKQEVFSLVASLTQPLRDVAPASGAYMNEVFIYEPDFETAFWGDNYPRLLALKHKY
ncbi:hypothetical protein K438DRAFT_1962362 [Mycena galopus ATCC 62051]|nr:hypothetical protein K438DRAFT_1962362 [Mycena galopus ATCC 62051]